MRFLLHNLIQPTEVARVVVAMCWHNLSWRSPPESDASHLSSWEVKGAGTGEQQTSSPSEHCSISSGQEVTVHHLFSYRTSHTISESRFSASCRIWGLPMPSRCCLSRYLPFGSRHRLDMSRVPSSKAGGIPEHVGCLNASPQDI